MASAITFEQLPSGSWRIKKMHNGKRYKKTLSYKPTELEAMNIITSLINADIQPVDNVRTFKDAYLSYIDSKSNVLSPSTIRGYESIYRRLPEKFVNTRLSDFSKHLVQKTINDYCVGRSAKTTANVHGLISAVLKEFKPELVLTTKLPAKEHKKEYIPSDEDITRILELVKGKKYEVPFRLACYGLRRGEICALTMDDIEGNFIRIHKDLVQDSNEEWVVKETPKTDESNRIICIDDYLLGLITDKGYVYKGHPENIRTNLSNCQNKLGIPHFSLHKMRHYFASTSHEMGLPEADIMAMGGWKTDHIMKAVYRHSKEKSKNESMQKYLEKMQNLVQK